MKTNENIRKEINLTQRDLAMLLGVSRGHLANYEIGLRDLSAGTLVILSQIERFLLLDAVIERRQFEKKEVQNQKKNDFIKEELKENELRKLACERKIERMKANYDAAIKQLQLIDFLSKKTANKNTLHSGAITTLREKANKTLNENDPLQLFKLELELKQLEHRELLLKQMATQVRNEQ